MSKKFYAGLGKIVEWPNWPVSFPVPGSLTYDDVLLIPQANTSLHSRHDTSLETMFGPWSLKMPIISAPMDTVSGIEMVRKLDELGAVGTLPRNEDFEQTLKDCEVLSDEKRKCVYALGLKKAFEHASQLKEKGAEMILLDIAHGGMEEVVRVASEIKSKTDLWVMVGNIVTYEQALVYKKAGIDIVRVGVGPGGACITRLVAGCGFPQLSAVLETNEAGITVIADGGVKRPGDAVKALAAGACVVMLGTMFAGTEEAPGEIVNGRKSFRGQASEEYMKDNGVKVDNFRAAEGVATDVPLKGSVSLVIDQLCGGIRSAMSYCGARNLDELREKAVFQIVSSAAREEGLPTVLKQ